MQRKAEARDGRGRCLNTAVGLQAEEKLWLRVLMLVCVCTMVGLSKRGKVILLMYV